MWLEACGKEGNGGCGKREGDVGGTKAGAELVEKLRCW